MATRIESLENLEIKVVGEEEEWAGFLDGRPVIASLTSTGNLDAYDAKEGDGIIAEDGREWAVEGGEWVRV